MGRISLIRRMSAFAMSITMVGFGLTGIASAQTITNTGPDSLNRIDSKVNNKCSVENNNNVSVKNSNDQSAYSGDATVGSSWGGWSALDPAIAKANGDSYNSWRDGVVGWMAQRSAGNGWNSTGDNLDWAPSGNSWNDFDPLAWQSNGQSFGNWYDGAQAYLDGNSSNWLFDWPGGTGNTFGGDATSGNATNNNNANFSININNAAGNPCLRQRNIAQQPTPGRGAGPSVPGSIAISSAAPRAHGAPGVGGAGGGVPGGAPSAGGFGAVSPSSQRVKAVSSAPSAPSAPGVGAVTSVSTPPKAVISNTGPSSSNTISSSVSNKTSVTNNNNVCVTNTNTQTASSGDSSVSSNTHSGSSDSGDAANGNATGVGAELSN